MASRNPRMLDNGVRSSWDGRVLITGGSIGGTGQLASTELYDPATGAFSAGPAMSVGRVVHRVAKLADGRVAIVGGFSGTTATTSVDLFDPATDTITAAAPLGTPVPMSASPSSPTAPSSSPVASSAGHPSPLRLKSTTPPPTPGPPPAP